MEGFVVRRGHGPTLAYSSEANAITVEREHLFA